MPTPTVTVDGVEYVTTSQAVEKLNAAGAGVDAGRLRDWKRRGLLDVVRDPDGNPLRVPVPGMPGRQNVWRWRDVAAVEGAVGTSVHGRPRIAASIG